jgi:hypothetical protein
MLDQPSSTEKAFDFSHFRWAHIPLALAALYLFAFFIGLLMTVFQLIQPQGTLDGGYGAIFGGTMLSYLLLLGPIALCLILLGVAMVKRLLAVKWIVGSVVVAALLIYAPLWIRATREIGKRFLPGSRGPLTSWLSIMMDFSMRAWQLIAPILFFTLPALALLLVMILDENKQSTTNQKVNKPPR